MSVVKGGAVIVTAAAVVVVVVVVIVMNRVTASGVSELAVRGLRRARCGCVTRGRLGRTWQKGGIIGRWAGAGP